MTSPFPGMDPYLERHWRDVHHRLITYSADQLRPKLPGDLRPRIEERVFVETDEGDRRDIYPDLRVVEFPRTVGEGVRQEAGTAVAEPFIIPVNRDPSSQGFIQIVDLGDGNRVVTVIEFVSPTNKVPGEGFRLYAKKQNEVIGGGASLVEIDLTRGGQHVLAFPLINLAPRVRTSYMACVTRAGQADHAEVYRLPFRERLPVIRIPLRPTDADVPLDLKAIVDQCYENGGYDNTDYRRPPEPPLDPPEDAWAEELLRSKGLR